MAQPLYFLPDVQVSRETPVAAKRAILQAAGIADVFADVPLEDLGCSPLSGRGPGDRSGTIIFYQSPVTDIPRRTGYYPNEQEWMAVDDGSQLWLGIDTASRPTPADLQRRKIYEAYELELGDGHTWSIPIIRSPSGATSLPQSQYIERGKLMQTIKGNYRRYWNTTAEAADAFYAGKKLTLLRAHELAVQALGINYRFGEHEQKLLGVIDSEVVMPVLMFTVDYPRVQYMHEQKKTAELPTAEESSSSTGSPDAGPTSAPVAASSS